LQGRNLLLEGLPFSLEHPTSFIPCQPAECRINADLSHAHLGHAKLIGAELLGAFFIETDLSGANLSCATALIKEKLEEAYLCETKLPKGIDLNPDRDCDMDWEEWRSDHGYT
jgi:uncharacterized protein YjbI with pentapeptide repeats